MILISIQNWVRVLIVIGVVALASAPWGEQIPIAIAYVFTMFLAFAYTYLFLPVSAVSTPLALALFFVVGPLTLILIGLFFRLMKKQMVKEEGMRL